MADDDLKQILSGFSASLPVLVHSEPMKAQHMGTQTKPTRLRPDMLGLPFAGCVTQGHLPSYA
jgi:hypothetical protein